MRVCQIGTSSLPEGQQWLKSFKVENDTYYLSLVSDTVTTDKAQNLDEVVIVSEAGRASYSSKSFYTNGGFFPGMQQQYHQTTGRIAANYQLSILNSQLALRFGIENLFDKRYTTYADWCDIPQKGRNIYVNLSFEL